MNRLSPLILLLSALTGLSASSDEPVEYNRDIRPILSENCFYCHGFDEESREAGLRLDTFADATDSDAIVPGEADASEILRRMLSDDADEVMPPPDTEKRLTKKQTDLIRQWIDQGAEYQEHWAWRPLRRPELPAAPQGVGPQREGNDIDAFLRAGWGKHGAEPVALATPREQLRRLSFDLRGLPPRPEEVREFEKHPSVESFRRWRDRWMSQLAYAEHQAVRWLDLVRWADTSGFVSDEPIAAGAYRAWVIRAIRQNVPFDQFSAHQLAGDLLPDPTDDQLIASGYNRIVNTNCEAGAIELEQLYKLKGEHVRALGTVWLGMTTGCAECHDHKFDPISAKDYYRLAAFFDDLVEAGVYTPGDRREPLHYVFDEAKDGQVDRRVSREVDALKRKIDGKAIDGLPEWESGVLAKLKDQNSRSDFVWIAGRQPAARVCEGEWTPIDQQGIATRQTEATPNEFRRHHIAETITGYVSHGGQKTDAAKDAWFVDVWLDPENRPSMVGFQVSHGRYGRLGWKTANYETYFWGNDTSETLSQPQSWSDPKRVKRIADLPADSGWVRLRVPYEVLIPAVSGQSFESVGMAWMHTGGRVRWGDSGLELRTDKATALALGETAMRKWWQRPKNRQVFERRAEFVAKAVRTPAAKRNQLQSEVVADAYRESTQPQLLSQLRDAESSLFTSRARAMPVLVSRRSEDRKTTRLLHRGDYQDESGPILSPSVPEFLNHADVEATSRLDLANWMFDEGSPLVARVFVNRLWHQFYGRGLSETLEDAGTQGDWPSHVALLDWLACEFRDSGWDRNHLVRLMTSAEAYRLSSRPSDTLAERDPTNRWHARQGRYRLTAEAIRDSALDVAGLLNLTSEVPVQSIFPYQPDPYWTRSDKVMFGSRHMVWATSPDTTQYRRSLYTFWKRQNVHPTLLAFDAPTRQECTARRNITNTPGQALALLNDPIFVEAARVFATRVIRECDPGLGQAEKDEAIIDRAFALALQRRPKRKETQVLLELLGHQREHYQQQPDEARRLLSIGQTPTPVAERSASPDAGQASKNVAEIAAWTAVTRTILNLHEFLNR